MSQPSNWPLPNGSSRIVWPYEITRQLATHPLTEDLYPVAFGHYVSARGHQVSRQTHTDYLLIFCHEGRGYYRASHNQTEQPISAGQLLLIPRGQAHSYRADPQQPWSIYWCHFQGQTAGHYMDYLGLTQQSQRLTLANWRSLLPDVTQLLNTQHQRLTLPRAILAAAALRKVLAQLPLLTAPQPQRSPFDWPSIERFMQDNLHRALTLADFAEFAGYSTYHFSKKFRHATGTSPARYFAELKIQHACRLLDNTTDSVRQIALALGFDDPYYFSRLFKKTMGLAPQFYRANRHDHQRH